MKSKISISPISLIGPIRPILIILTTAVFSFSSGFVAYYIPVMVNQKAAVSSFNQTSKPARAVRGRMWLQSSKSQSFQVGKRLTLEVVIDAGGKVVNAADAVLSFDPKSLQLLKIQGSVPDKGLTLAWSLVRKQVKGGKIYLTALKETPDKNPTGKITLATLVFKPLKRGESKITFDFFPGKTYGSTVIRASDSANILDKVSGITILIE